MTIKFRQYAWKMILVFILSVFSLSIEFMHSKSMFRQLSITEFFFIGVAVLSCIDESEWQWREVAVGGIFSFFVLVGRAFIDYKWDAWIAHIDAINLVKWIVVLPGFFLLCACPVHYVYARLRILEQEKLKEKGNSHWMDAYPWWPFLILILLWLPSYIFCFPGIMIPGDNGNQIIDMFNTISSGNMQISAHHPVLHTVLLGGSIWIGHTFIGSDVIGYGLFTGLQGIVFIFAVSYAIHYLYTLGIPFNIRFIIVCFIGLNPMFSNMLVTTTKDVFYAAFLLLFIVELAKEMKGQGRILLLIIFATGAILFRNEGIYVLFAALLIAAIFNRKYRLGIISLALLFLHLLIGRVIYPNLHIKPGSVREVLSVPMQTMARYIIGHEGDWTEEEERAILKIQIIEDEEAWYEPNSVDSIKNLSAMRIGNNFTNKEVITYLKTWIRLGMRHPLTYIDGFLDMKNQYMYPSRFTGITEVTVNTLTTENSQYSFDWLNVIHLNLYYSKSLERARQIYESFRTKLQSLSIFRYLCISPTYVWLAIASIFFFLKKRGRKEYAFQIMMGMMVLVLFASPLDGGDFRYTYPLAIIEPFCFLISLYFLRQEDDDTTRIEK